MNHGDKIHHPELAGCRRQRNCQGCFPLPRVSRNTHTSPHKLNARAGLLRHASLTQSLLDPPAGPLIHLLLYPLTPSPYHALSKCFKDPCFNFLLFFTPLPFHSHHHLLTGHQGLLSTSSAFLWYRFHNHLPAFLHANKGPFIHILFFLIPPCTCEQVLQDPFSSPLPASLLHPSTTRYQGPFSPSSSVQSTCQ